jgi:hypothetical protein
MGRYLEIFRREPIEGEIREESEKSARSTLTCAKRGTSFAMTRTARTRLAK